MQAFFLLKKKRIIFTFLRFVSIFANSTLHSMIRRVFHRETKSPLREEYAREARRNEARRNEARRGEAK